ncbi:hypothetical protein Tco_1210795 [Tanacetum coccineum]
MSNTNTNLLLNHMVFFTTDTVILCSTSKVQEKTQLLKERCMQSIRAIQSQFKFLTDTLQDFGTMPIFKRTFAQDLDLLEQHLTKEIISQTDCKTILTKLRTTFENAFNSEFKEQVQDDNNRPGNDIDADDADIRPIYDEEPMAEVQLTAEYYEDFNGGFVAFGSDLKGGKITGKALRFLMKVKLGLQVKQQPDGIFISQDKYVADILKKFDFYSIKTTTTPIEFNKPLVKDEDGVDVDVHVYMSLIGSLMYLTASRPNIMDSPFELETYSDSDYEGASLDRKSILDVLQSCAKHNMVAYLEKTDGNTDFHEIIDFLTRSSIHYALTVSLVVSTTFVEQFWMSAKSKIINNVRYITAKVAGKPVNISEASIRSDLLFDDADGIDSLHNQAIFDAIQLMGYEGDLTVLTFNKALFSPQWRFLFHTMNHCISSKSTSWDQIPTNIATAVICLATNQKYNFSKLIFDGMMRHLDAKKKFVMYPRFIPVFLTNQLKNVPVPLDHFPINALTTKVFSFMVKKGKSFSGNVTPLFPSMLAQPTEDEGAVSERPSETQPTSSPTHPSENRIEPQPDPSLRPSSSNPIPDSIPEGSGGNHGCQSSSDRSLSGNEDGLTLQSVYDLCVSLCKQGRKSTKSEPTMHKDLAFDDLNDVDVNDAMDYMETDAYMQKGVSTAELKDGTSDESTTPITIFRDDETIAEFLVSMSQNKDKQKGPRLRKGVLEEEAESDAESEGVDEAKRKFDQLAKDEEIARKEEKMRAGLRRLNEESKDPKKKRVVNETPREEDTAKVPAEQEVTEQEENDPGDFGNNQQDWEIVSWRLMLDLGLEVKEESAAALHLDQTVPGKDKSNILIVDSLLKTIRLSIHLVVYNEELAIPEQTATDKGISNPLMAGCLPKTTKPT